MNKIKKGKKQGERERCPKHGGGQIVDGKKKRRRAEEDGRVGNTGKRAHQVGLFVPSVAMQPMRTRGRTLGTT